ncbi:snake venom metalloproteinase lebetase-4-like isoform X2 [Babylonia areolata]
MKGMEMVTLSIIVVAVMTALTASRTVPETSGITETMRKTVEVAVVVDRHAYRQWRRWQNESREEEREASTQAAITRFVKATFVGANLIWKGMEEYNVYLDLRIDTIRVVREGDIVTANADGTSVMNEVAFWDFHRWLVRNGMEFDHALLLTGLNLAAEDSSSHEGYAYMDTMCGHRSLSVVENIINGIPAVVFAHEVGHSLSARHDGGRNNHCNSSSGFIMNANNIGTSPRHWNFSSCSARAVSNKIHQLSQTFDCLSEDSTR